MAVESDPDDLDEAAERRLKQAFEDAMAEVFGSAATKTTGKRSFDDLSSQEQADIYRYASAISRRIKNERTST